jgi:hypothetical protein
MTSLMFIFFFFGSNSLIIISCKNFLVCNDDRGSRFFRNVGNFALISGCSVPWSFCLTSRCDALLLSSNRPQEFRYFLLLGVCLHFSKFFSWKDMIKCLNAYIKIYMLYICVCYHDRKFGGGKMYE